MILTALMKSGTSRDSWLIFLFGMLVFTIGLQPEFIGFQSRFALFAREMLHNGPTFFPTIYQTPYPDYPATSTFLIYLISLPLGKVTMLSSVLPTAMTSALILVFTYRIGALQSRQWGIYAVLLALLTFEFFAESRTISLDQYTSLATIGCFYLAYSASIFDQYKRLWFIPLLFVLGFCFRGPIGMVIPAAVTCGFFGLQKQYKKCLIFGLTALVLLVFCSMILLAAAKVQGGEELVQNVIHRQVIGRVTHDEDNSLYYLTKGFTAYAVSFPLAVLVALFSYRHIFKHKDVNNTLLMHLILWTGIILLGMSIPGSKKTRYILPLVPALALLSSYLFVNFTSNEFFSKIQKLFLWGCQRLPFAAVVGAAVLCIPNTYYHSIPLRSGLIGLILLFSLIVVIFRINMKFQDHSSRHFVILSGAVLSFIIFNIWIIDPMVFFRERTKPFVEKVESLRKNHTVAIAFYRIGPDAEDIKFAVNMPLPFKPRFIKKQEDILNQPPQTIILTRKKIYKLLPEDITEKVNFYCDGKIGHKQYIVFSRKEVAGDDITSAAMNP